MDHYHTVHEPDVASFGLEAGHRLPTVSATQALEDSGDVAGTHIATGLGDLDRSLLGLELPSPDDNANLGGVKRGQVTEFWGPPGSGRTALGAQLAASALRTGGGVLWVECFRPTPKHRILEAVQFSSKAPQQSATPASEVGVNVLGNFASHKCLTLPHLLALILRPTPISIPTNVSIVILDSLTALVNAALPKSNDGRTNSRGHKGPTPSVKRRQGLQTIMSALQRLAGARNCAVVLLSQCATKMHPEGGATLTPAVNAAVWDQGLATRVALFRDWVWRRNEPAGVFLAGIQKLDGKDSAGVVDHVSAFQMDNGGLLSVSTDALQPTLAMPDAIQPKRKLGQTDLEVPDSEDDEDYGWVDEDEAALPAPPPQWQGSEDILLGQNIGRSDDEEEENGGEEFHEFGYEDRASEGSIPSSPTNMEKGSR